MLVTLSLIGSVLCPGRLCALPRKAGSVRKQGPSAALPGRALTCAFPAFLSRPANAGRGVKTCLAEADLLEGYPVTRKSRAIDRARAKGLIITTLGVLILTPDALLVRLVGLDPLTLVVPRGLLLAVGVFAIMLVLRGRRTFAAFRTLGRSGAWMVLLFALGHLCFVTALDRTSVANVLVLLAVMPLFAALLGRVVLGERLPPRTLLAIAAALTGTLVVAGESLGEPTLTGDLTAMAAALLYAAFFVMVRRRPEVDRMPTVALGGLTAALIALVAGQVLGPGMAELTLLDWRQVLWILLMGLVVQALSFACIVTGPRYITAAEVSLLMLLEAVFGPLWVWLVLAEEPPVATLIGGGIILAALAWHSLDQRTK